MSVWAQQASARALRSPAAVTLLMRWQVVTGGSVDPTTGMAEGGATSEESLSLPALVHEVQPATRELRRFAEVETGDLIVDLAPDAPVDGKQALRFELGGRTYRPADTGTGLARHYDAQLAAGATFRTLLLKRQP